MESSSALTLSQLPYVYPTIPSTNKNYPFWPAGKRRSSQLSTRLQCNKMFVPGMFTTSILYLLGCDLWYFMVYRLLSIIVYHVMLSLMQDSEKQHLKQRLPKTYIISSPTLQLKLLLLNLRCLPSLLILFVFLLLQSWLFTFSNYG